jgi:hypothetical protein
MAAVAEREATDCDVALTHNYVFAVNDRFLEVQADNDLLAFARVIELFPRDPAVLLSKKVA